MLIFTNKYAILKNNVLSLHCFFNNFRKNENFQQKKFNLANNFTNGSGFLFIDITTVWLRYTHKNYNPQTIF